MSSLLLPPSTSMDAVTLHTGDIDRLSTYYVDAFGLEVLPDDAGRPQAARRGARVVLGRGQVALLVLVHTPDLPPARPGQTGLFHTALVYSDRASLAAAVLQASRHPMTRFTGAADHLVSQAFYFDDPDGNGVELYWDRPRAEWTWREGRVDIAVLPLDPAAFLDRHLGDDGASRAQVGHVHLKVGDIDRARAFYVDALGFEVTATMGTRALFVSAGGYHHHMAVNTWTSAGAGPRAATIGLGQVSVVVPGRDDVAALATRLRRHGVAHTDDGRTLRFEDPWKSLIEVGTA